MSNRKRKFTRVIITFWNENKWCDLPYYISSTTSVARFIQQNERCVLFDYKLQAYSEYDWMYFYPDYTWCIMFSHPTIKLIFSEIYLEGIAIGGEDSFSMIEYVEFSGRIIWFSIHILFSRNYYTSYTFYNVFDCSSWDEERQTSNIDETYILCVITIQIIILELFLMQSVHIPMFLIICF